MNNRRKRFWQGAIASAVAFYTSLGYSETWVYTPSINVGASYEDNYRLTTRPHDSTTGLYLGLGVGVNRIGDDYSLDGLLKLDFNHFNGDNVPDENDQLLRVRLSKDMELDDLSLLASYRRDSTLRDVSGGFDLSDPTAVVNPDTGITTLRIRRNTFRLFPSWERRLNELTSVRLDYEFRNVDYSSAEGQTDLNDYYTNRLKGTLYRNLTELDKANVSAEYLSYSSDAKNSDYDTVSLRAGLDHDFSETLAAGFSIGARNTNGDAGDDTGVVYEIHGTKKSELGFYTARLERQQTPSGSGDINNTDQLLFQMTRGISPTLSMKLRARYFIYDSSNNAKDRDYFLFQPSLAWSFSRWWTMNMTYSYSRQKYDIESDAAENNGFFVDVTYSKPSGPTK